MIIAPVRQRYRFAPGSGLRQGPLGLLVLGYFVGALLCLLFVDPACCRFDPAEPAPARVWGGLLGFWLSLAAFSLVRHWRSWSKRSPVWAALLAPFALAALLAVLTYPYLYAVDAVAGSQAVTYRGEVTGRWTRDGRSTLYGMRLRDARSGRELSLKIDKRQYDALRIGDRAVCEYRRGRMGFYFRWRFGAAPRCRFGQA